jgi:hypothetical protein
VFTSETRVKTFPHPAWSSPPLGDGGGGGVGPGGGGPGHVSAVGKKSRFVTHKCPEKNVAPQQSELPKCPCVQPRVSVLQLVELAVST